MKYVGSKNRLSKYIIPIIQSKSGNVVYCDPPYKGTTGYKDGINYNQFYEWVRKLSRNNIVFISEYNMPSDFRCIWEYKHETTLDTKKHKERIERLWVYNG